MQHTISVLVENKFGVLTRVAGLFSGRGYNIDTLNVGPTHEPAFSRMTIVTHGDDSTLEQIVKQLNKLPRWRICGPRTGAGEGRRGFQVARRGHADHGHFPRKNRGCAAEDAGDRN